MRARGRIIKYAVFVSDDDTATLGRFGSSERSLVMNENLVSCGSDPKSARSVARLTTTNADLTMNKTFRWATNSCKALRNAVFISEAINALGPQADKIST